MSQTQKLSSKSLPYRMSRIRCYFSQELMDYMYDIVKQPLGNNDKFNILLELLTPMGFKELGAGTNRMAVMKNHNIYKIALDTYGIRDNWQEFKVSKDLQPYVTKTYECNGLIAVAEYVNLITKKEFNDSKFVICDMLKEVSKRYIFEDVGIADKNFCNYGYRDDGSLVILDYGYMYPIDRKIMFCEKDGGPISYNTDYTKLRCEKCYKVYTVFDIVNKMQKSESQFIESKDMVKIEVF